MNRKYYTIVANVVARLPEDIRPGVAHQFAVEFGSFANFDKLKFLTACRVA